MLSRPYHFKFFKGCLPQILLGSFLNTLTHLHQKNKKKHALRSTNNQVKFVEDNLVESTGNIGTESTVAPKVQETLITG